MKLHGLYAITPEQTPKGKVLPNMAEAAIQGGARIIQYRDKSDDHRRRAQEALSLLHICHAGNALLIINDDVELAAAVGADGVHLGRDDMPPAQARECIGPHALIGVSCYNRLDSAERAAALGADYVAFGRFFPSSSKPMAIQAHPELLRQARDSLDLPIVAIGGISPQNGELLIVAGANMLAVIDAVFGADDIHAAALAFCRLFHQERHR